MSRKKAYGIFDISLTNLNIFFNNFWHESTWMFTWLNCQEYFLFILLNLNICLLFSVGNIEKVWLGSLTATCRTYNPEVTQGRRFDSAPGHCRVTTLGKLFTHMCLCHQAVKFGSGQRAVMPRGWQSNRRSGVALVMHHGLSGLSTYGLKG